jgi:hypothetical protein
MMKAAVLALFVLSGLTGCAEFPLSRRPAAGYIPVNHRGDARLPAEIQRVALLPSHGGEIAQPESAAAMDAVLLSALQRQLRFEVVTISREDCQRLFGAPSFASTDALPHGMIEKIAERYAVDAVLFTDLTLYRPYRPISLGFRAKLATVRDVRLVWALDEMFSAEQDAMIASVRSYYRKGDRPSPTDPVDAVLQSPARFGAVAADLMFKTLPPR